MSAPRYIAVFGEEPFPSGDNDALQLQGLTRFSLGDDAYLWASDHAIRIGEFGFIIGHRGETLDSLQYLASLVANHVDESYYRITLDFKHGFHFIKRL